jgi:hypothetical protein
MSALMLMAASTSVRTRWDFSNAYVMMALNLTRMNKLVMVRFFSRLFKVKQLLNPNPNTLDGCSQVLLIY